MKKQMRHSSVKKSEHQPPHETELLDPKRAQSLSMFLGSLHTDYHILISAIKEIDTKLITDEKAQLLQHAMPLPEEISILEAAVDIPEEQKELLSNGDKFLLNLMAIPGYHVLIDCIVQQFSYPSESKKTESKVSGFIQQLSKVVKSKQIDFVLMYILDCGNFVNFGDRRLGDAPGFHLDVFEKLRGMKSNVNNISLLHFIVDDIQQKEPSVYESLATMAKEISVLPAEIDIKSLKATATKLKNKNDQLKQKAMKESFWPQFENFFTAAAKTDKALEENVNILDQQLHTLREMWDTIVSLF